MTSPRPDHTSPAWPSSVSHMTLHLMAGRTPLTGAHGCWVCHGQPMWHHHLMSCGRAVRMSLSGTSSQGPFPWGGGGVTFCEDGADLLPRAKGAAAILLRELARLHTVPLLPRYTEFLCIRWADKPRAEQRTLQPSPPALLATQTESLMRLWVSGLESGASGKTTVVKTPNGSTWLGPWWPCPRRDPRSEHLSLTGSCPCPRTASVIPVRRHRARALDETRKVQSNSPVVTAAVSCEGPFPPHSVQCLLLHAGATVETRVQTQVAK